MEAYDSRYISSIKSSNRTTLKVLHQRLKAWNVAIQSVVNNTPVSPEITYANASHTIALKYMANLLAELDKANAA